MSSAMPDPEVTALVRRFATRDVPTYDRAGGVLAARELLERGVRLQGDPTPVDEVGDLLLPGAAGLLPARRYAHRADPSRPLALYLHGGGWALGSVESADGPCRDLAARSGCVVVSLGYRLAPETRFPGPLQDCVAAATALVDDPTLAGGVPGCGVALVGDSAGGNLAAAAALALRERRPGGVRRQVLVYPCLHPARDSPFASYVQRADGPFMTARELRWLWDLYVTEERARDPLAAPLLAPDLTGLPPATILLAGLDPLHDEGHAYAQRLRDAGVDVTTSTWPGQPHGFWWMRGALPRAREATDVIAAALGGGDGPAGR